MRNIRLHLFCELPFGWAIRWVRTLRFTSLMESADEVIIFHYHHHLQTASDGVRGDFNARIDWARQHASVAGTFLRKQQRSRLSKRFERIEAQRSIARNFARRARAFFARNRCEEMGSNQNVEPIVTFRSFVCYQLPSMTFKTLLFSGPFQLSIKKQAQSNFRTQRFVSSQQTMRSGLQAVSAESCENCEIGESALEMVSNCAEADMTELFPAKMIHISSASSSCILLFFRRMYQKSKQNCENSRSTCWALQSFIKMCNRFFLSPPS